jgi:hypothetical protein
VARLWGTAWAGAEQQSWTGSETAAAAPTARRPVNRAAEEKELSMEVSGGGLGVGRRALPLAARR